MVRVTAESWETCYCLTKIEIQGCVFLDMKQTHGHTGTHAHTHTHAYSLELRRIMALRQTYSSLCSLSSLTRDVAAISISKISAKPCTQLPSSLV